VKENIFSIMSGNKAVQKLSYIGGVLKVEKDEKYLRAKKRVENLKAFYLHFISYVLVNSMLFVFNLISDPGNWWFQYPLFGWGIGLLVHGASTFAFGIFGEEWEEKKIKKYMEKDR
jgi:2TM domain